MTSGESHGIALLALCATVSPPGAVAQETINYASVSGRVTDPSGGVVAGATGHRASNRNQPDRRGDDRRRRALPLSVPESRALRNHGAAAGIRRCHAPADADGRRGVRAAGRARRSPRWRTSVTVTAPAIVLEAARSQIAGTISQTEVKNLPLNGRNFLDLALLVPGVSPPNVGGTQLFAETSAVPGVGISVGSQRNFSNNFIVDGLSANDDAAGLSGIPYGVDAVDQFQVVTSGGQAELGRALGGYINVVTKSGTNAAARRRLRLLARRSLQCAQRADDRPRHWRRHEAADEPAAVRGEPGRPDRPRPHVLLLELRAAQAGSVRSRDDFAGQCQRHQRPAGGGRLSGFADRDRRLSQSGAHHQLSRQGRSPVQRQGSVQRSLQPVRRHVQQLARRRRAERAERVGGAGQHRSDDRGQQHRDAVAAHGQRDAGAVRVRRSEGAADRSDRAGGQHRRRRLVRDALGEPAAAR